MTKQLLARIEQLFAERLAAKTGWGRNEVMAAYKAAVSDALMEQLA